MEFLKVICRTEKSANIQQTENLKASFFFFFFWSGIHVTEKPKNKKLPIGNSGKKNYEKTKHFECRKNFSNESEFPVNPT